ncbi:hypothetical protein FRB90_012720 [Tulasnella sp. 427]|nr:hypothetical protein FRB90_012720 [Tulasnella sp. 427]
MSSFADLMKVAEANTRSSNREALEAAKRKEAAVRQAREEQERKEKAERERQRQMMLQRVEEAKRQEDQRKKKEEEAAKRKEELVKKKVQDTEQAKYGVAGPSKDGSSRVKPPSQYIVVSSGALTREEKRMAKDPLRKDEVKNRKAGATASRQRRDNRLPGGALNATDSAGSSASPSGSRISSPAANGMTARARLTSHFAPTLTKLNTEKRDTRTIDEITRDLKRGRIGGSGEVDSILSGEKAQNFGDWFAKKDKGKAVEAADAKKRPDAANAVPARTNGLSANGIRTLKPNASGRALQSAVTTASINTQARSRPEAASRQLSANSAHLKPQTSATTRKRSRERSSSIDSFIEDDEDSEEERRYAKRKAGAGSRRDVLDDDLGGDTRDLIWQLMGRKRSEYMSRDVDSDDDMEVTGFELEREELRSARIAKREDAMEEAEEKRREEEKRRRKGGRKQSFSGPTGSPQLPSYVRFHRQPPSSWSFQLAAYHTTLILFQQLLNKLFDKMLFGLSFLSVALASLSLVSAVPHEQARGLVRKPHYGVSHHQKRFPGRATWYDVGLGACGNHNSPGDYIVALNSHQLDTSRYPPVQCGRKVLITWQGKSAVATVQDECPGCPFGALDMSKGLFQHFTGLGTGEFQMSWQWTDGSGGSDDDDDDKKDNSKDDDDDDDDDKKKTTTTHRTTTTTRKTTTTTTTTTTKKTSSTTSTTTSSSSTTTSSAAPDSDDDTTTDDSNSNIANQQQLIAQFGALTSKAKSS